MQTIHVMMFFMTSAYRDLHCRGKYCQLGHSFPPVDLVLEQPRLVVTFIDL